MSLNSDPRIVVALDFPSGDSALELVEQLDPEMCRLKIGKELFTRSGPELVKAVQSRGFDVFLDLKFHDIPNTAASAVEAAADLGVWMVNVHASGGAKMMEACRMRLEPLGPDKPILIAVTVLTSMADEELPSIGVSGTAAEQVQRLARLTRDSGLDGVVCSAREAVELKAAFGQGFQLVTPGIRPADADVGDQQRIMTPGQAIQAGSDYLVIGRPITRAEDPLGALRALHLEVSEAMEGSK